jgi:leucyl/phenylalanyl-tRNA--protein transferase
LPEADCLAFIRSAWRDIRPASAQADGSAYSTEPGNDQQYVHLLFDRQANATPDSTAVVSAARKMSYYQLAESTNRIASHLRGIGVGPETVVGVYLERGIDAIRCLLAVLKAGGAYLPLDPALPEARLAQMCDEARPAVILADRAAQPGFSSGQVLLIDELVSAEPATSDGATRAAETRLRPENLAYVIYTSGSTGKPKAVAVSHGSLTCVMAEISRSYGITGDDRVLQLASLGFDTSVEQILVTLLSGATLMLPDAGTVAPTDLLSYLAAEQVTVVDLTPAYWHQLLALTRPGDDRLRAVRLMITGGDMADQADCVAAVRASHGARLLNAYGLTETTITTTLFDASALGGTAGPAERAAEPVPVPVGRPIPHAQVLVLDENLNTVPPGAVGEIYIGGCCVARGYLGEPTQTAERFPPNPYSEAPGSRMYRTGDLGCWREDKNLKVIGRADRQLKVRGFRVDPAEIESVLASHPDIDAAAVVACEAGPGNKQLVAYYTCRRPGPGPADHLAGHVGDATLRNFVAARVPGFMVPSLFIALDQLPLAPDGRTDLQALPHPAITVGGLHGDFTPVQAGMSHLWSRVLKTGRVGLGDDFFELGGDSLLAAEMLAQARAMFGLSAKYIRPLTRSLLSNPTLRSFAAATQDARAGRLPADGTDQRIDFTREAALTCPVRRGAEPRQDRQWPSEILLTGSTGFLGIHLLRELLTDSAARVRCLVRARDGSEARRRITRAAQRYGIEGLDMDRVVPLPGDLAAPDLGLPTGTFDELARTVDVIHHVGALVNFTYPYEELRAANVTGTAELIRLAGRYRGIPVNYQSTAAVLAGFGAMGVRDVTEYTPLAYAEQLCVGYLETKFVAEELVRNAGKAGLPVAIYRPLDIAGDHRSGVWNTSTELCALIRFMTDTGVAPNIDLPLDLVPVDICAAAIRHISARAAAPGRTYHLASPKHTLLGSLVDRLRCHGFAIREVPYSEWVDELLRTAAADPAHPMTPFLPLFIDRCGDSELTVAEMYFEHVFPSYTRSNTEQALRDSGIAFPIVDEELLDRNIDYLITTGYLKDPTGGQSALQRRRKLAGFPPMPVSHYPDWDSFEIGSRPADRPVAFCGDLSPASVLGAYRHGVVPFPAPDEYVRNFHEIRHEQDVGDGVIAIVGAAEADPYWVAWWSPDPRPVLEMANIHLGRNVRKQLRRGHEWTTANAAFRRVADECRAGREPRWLTDTLLETMIQLHQEGWAHSIEVWQDEELIGGAFGIGVGCVLSGDSLFGRRPNAARVAVADMAARFGQAGGLLIDAQWDTPFLRSMGAGLIPRSRYLSMLAGAAERRELPREPLPARRLLRDT